MSSARFAGRIRRGHILTIATVAVGIAATPFALTPYPLALLTLALAYGLFAFGLDLTWGRAGVVSIGHAAFFGIGAYGVAIATDNDQHMLLGALAGIAISVLVALAIGRIGLGSKTLPSTMAILTLAATLLAQQVALSWRGTTGGSNGIFVASSGVVPDFYRTAAVVFVVVICVWFFVIRGQWGRRFRAVQSNEIRAAHLGIDPRQTKVISFCLSAAVAAIAGALAAPVMGLVSPSAAGIMLSTQVLVWLAVGGRGSIAGAFLGAGLISIGERYLGDAIGSWYLLVLGIVFILVVRFAPSGLVGSMRLLTRRPLSETAALGALLRAPEPPTQHQSAGGSGRAALSLESVEKSFGASRVIDEVTMDVTDGEVVCLIGPNGAGKTTLLNIMAGNLPASRGTTRYFGQDISRWSIHRRARLGLGKVFQIPSVFADLTPAQNIQIAQSEANWTVPMPVAYQRFVEDESILAADLPLADRRALELAMVLAWGPQVILLDEPAAGLSHEESIGLAQRLREVAEQNGCTLVTVEHDMEIVRELADRVIVLANGSLLVDGSMDEVSDNADVRRAYLGA